MSPGLHWACKLGREDMVRVLLTADSDVNAKSNSGMTPLHLAAQCGYDAIINILIANSKSLDPGFSVYCANCHNNLYGISIFPSSQFGNFLDILSSLSSLHTVP